MSRIYLDHAATSPLRPQARAAMEAGFALWANPSSPHGEGRGAKIALEDARARVKAALHWDGEVIFTSGASEALAIGMRQAKADRQVVSAVEHDAVFRAAPEAQIAPIAVGHCEIDPDRLGDLVGDLLGDLLGDAGAPIVAIQHVNSETGTVQPIGALAAQIRGGGGRILSDCAQSAGKLALPDCDMAVISAHKFGGPIGIGALLVKDFALLEPTGGHERGYRQGTENLPGAMGMAAALELGGYAGWGVDEAAMRAFAGALGAGPGAGTSCAHILALTHPNIRAQALLIRLDAMGCAVSAGSACSSGTLKKSRVLDAFGYDDAAASRTIRVSMGWNTRPEDLARFAEAWSSL